MPIPGEVATADPETSQTAALGTNPYGRPLRRDSEWSMRKVLLHPVNLVPIPVWVLMIFGRKYGFVDPRIPWWVLFGSLVLAHLGSTLFALAFPPGTPRAKPVVHLVFEMSLIGIAIYSTGWGVLLAVGFIFSASGHMGIDGSRLGRPAIYTSALIIAIGELAVVLGVPSLVPEPQGHGLALLEAAGVGAAIWIMSFTQREKEAAEADVRRSEERLSALVQYAADAIMVLDSQGTISYASPAVHRLLGYAPEQLTRLDRDLVHPDHIEHARSMFAEVRSRPRGLEWIELPLRHVDGRFLWFEVGLNNLLDDPAVNGLVCNLRDVTERRSAQEQLVFQAHHDPLTRLPNRWLFIERLELAQRAAAEENRCVAVLFLDVDQFKLVNDSLGHDVGDRMLVSVAERLMECLRPKDVVARFGGDEFTILLADLSDAETAMRIADRIIESLRQSIAVDEHELFVSASLGVAISHSGTERANDLLRDADLAMYVAKEKGRGRWELFDPSFTPRVMERLELEGDLRRALDNGELIVQFQPEVMLKTGRVVSAEALVRWMHPRRGMLEPESFIPFAEESSLIVAIDRWVLQEACRWARRWSTMRASDAPLVVSVNFSPRFMRQPDMVGDVMRVLRATGVDPRSIQIEITERSALTDIDSTCSQLHQLRGIGVRVAVDDFGTGYSSLSYLKQLPIDVLKLDKSFVDGLDSGPADVAIVQAIVTMGHALGVKVTAEGVERPEQAARLRELGCDAAMGWLWSPSLPPEQLAGVAESGFAPEGGARHGVVVPLRARG